MLQDPYGVRPLSLGRLKDGGYIVASETCAFDLIEAGAPCAILWRNDYFHSRK